MATTAAAASRAAGVYIVAARRTAFGAFGGALKTTSAVDLGVVATQAALGDANNLSATAVDACFFGNVIQTGNDAAYLARHVALKSGCDANRTPSLTVNRLCGSGFETVIQAAHSIRLGESDLCIAGGTEQMSQAPLVVGGTNVRWGTALGSGLQLGDALWDGLTDSYAGIPMGVTAENLAQQYSISREECDVYAIQSQQRWGKAHAAGVFDNEIATVTIPTKKKGDDLVFDTDEHPRPDSELDKIARLKPVFKKDGGVVTAANASGICDGAGSIIVASEAAVQEHNLTPLCRVVSTAVTGCDPKIMGIGPVQAIRNALAAAGGDLTLDDMDLIEINEAFAAQFLACAKELKLDTDKTNVHGGAIALGHPLGASGSRITAHLAHQFRANPHHQYHIGAACIGGGQGIAVLLQRC